MLEQLPIWLDTHAGTLAWIGGLSFALLLLSLLASPWLLAHLPADYFAKPSATKLRTPGQLIVASIRTLFGLFFAVLGLILMVTPGPGLVCLVLGLALCDFPGKHALLVKLIEQPNVLPTLNWLRKKGNQPPFTSPGDLASGNHL